jgi:hypothetical protein
MTLVLMLLLTLAAPPEPSPKPSPRPEAKPLPDAKPAAAEHRAVNVRLEIKITERRAESSPVTKVVSMTVADRRNGMIRASNGTQPSGEAFKPAALNVDATPMIDSEGRVGITLGIEYNVNDQSPDAKGLPLRAIREQFFVIAESGKPLLVSDSADPVGDRRIQIEVTATVLR